MNILYDKYCNIWTCFIEYRKCDILDKKLTFEQFKTKIEQEQYINHIVYSPNKEIFSYLYLFKDDAFMIRTADIFESNIINLINKKNKANLDIFKKYLDSKNIQNSKILNYAKSNLDIILITKKELSTYIKKKISDINLKIIVTKSKIKFHNYLHKHFLLDIKNGPLCSPHTILTKEEVRKLCTRELMIHPLSLPSILINDPQIIWIGAELGDIIKIEANSEMAGKVIRYRIVTPTSGKVITEQNQNADFESDIEEEYDSDYKSENEENNEINIDENISETEEYSEIEDDEY
jgi:DNA-directed RNA polymerase subunit H (RpoH/RPB5)